MGPGQLQRQTWADGERRWRTFHYALPVACPPCHVGFAVGPFRMVASALPPAKDGGGGGGAADNGSAAQGAAAGAAAASRGDPQLTSFAPQQAPAELAVAAVLAAKPCLAPANGSGSEATDGLARSAHFTGLVWRLFEEVLGARCPLPAMQQVGRRCVCVLRCWCGFVALVRCAAPASRMWSSRQGLHTVAACTGVVMFRLSDTSWWALPSSSSCCRSCCGLGAAMWPQAFPHPPCSPAPPMRSHAPQAFLPPELLRSGGGQVAQGLQLLSTAQLIQPRAIEQSSEWQQSVGTWPAGWLGV